MKKETRAHRSCRQEGERANAQASLAFRSTLDGLQLKRALDSGEFSSWKEMYLAAPHSRKMSIDHLHPSFHSRNIRVHGVATVSFLAAFCQFTIWWVRAYDWVAASSVAFVNEPLVKHSWPRHSSLLWLWRKD